MALTPPWDETVYFGFCTFWTDDQRCLAKTTDAKFDALYRNNPNVSRATLAASRPDVAMPCCPHCGSMLQMQAKAMWDRGMARYEREHPEDRDYRAMWDWSKTKLVDGRAIGRCYRDLPALRAAWRSRN